jgi:hypothetical protein
MTTQIHVSDFISLFIIGLTSVERFIVQGFRLKNPKAPNFRGIRIHWAGKAVHPLGEKDPSGRRVQI